MAISRAGTLYRSLRLLRNKVVVAAKRLRHVDSTASIHRTAHVSSDLVAHQYVYVGPECQLSPMVQIGAYSLLAPRVAVVGGDHLTEMVGIPMQFSGRPVQARTTIGRDVWIGYGAVISRGVTIGEGAIVGAGSVVTKDIPDYEVWAGVPARKIRDRFDVDVRAKHRAGLDRGDFLPTFAEVQTAAKPESYRAMTDE